LKVINSNMEMYSFNTIYEGFLNLEEVKNSCVKLNLNIQSLVFIYIFDAYYAVGFEDYCKQLIVNKEYFFYNDNGLWKQRLMRNKYKNIPSLVNNFSYKNINQTIFQELIQVYPDTKCFIYKNDNFFDQDKFSVYHYYVILGLYFKEKFYTIDNILELDAYFKHLPAFISFLKKYPFIESINPFKQQAKLNNGKICNYQYVYKNYETYFEIPRYAFK
jgi:hypothetical protein